MLEKAEAYRKSIVTDSHLIRNSFRFQNSIPQLEADPVSTVPAVRNASQIPHLNGSP